jgi:hypothetical protein
MERKETMTIEKETKKAYLLEEDGKTFWIQKRWLREDGTLTKAGEKARDEALNPKTLIFKGEAVRETEKAVLLNMEIVSKNFDGRKEYWMPKSAIQEITDSGIVFAEWGIGMIQNKVSQSFWGGWLVTI